jgi:hypothetical protein
MVRARRQPHHVLLSNCGRPIARAPARCPWRPFTETTLTAVIPLLAYRDFATGIRTLRLWIIVLTANLAGAHLGVDLGPCAYLLTRGSERLPEIGTEPASVTPGAAVLKGVLAGWLIAMVVWLLASARGGSHRHHRDPHVVVGAPPTPSSPVSCKERNRQFGPLGGRLRFAFSPWRYSRRRLAGFLPQITHRWFQAAKRLFVLHNQATTAPHASVTSRDTSNV